jgi:ABC-type multidrug transport system ATPase subunit
MKNTESAVVARRLQLSTRRGPVFGPVSFEAAPGSVTAVLGASGTGKTALLLTLSGRMRPSSGSASVYGLDIARDASRVRRISGLGLIPGVNDLEEALTAEQHVLEQRLILGRSRRTNGDVLARTGLAEARSLKARDMCSEQRVRLGVALALVGNPKLIVADDLDRDLTAEQVERVGVLLRELAADGITILASCLDGDSARFADALILSAPLEEAAEATQEVLADAFA